jgi:hypothetical protein
MTTIETDDRGFAPGIYTMTREAYHADPCGPPSLTSSTIKRLCLDSPAHAWAEHPRLNPAAEHEEAEHLDVGTAAHALLLEGRNAVAIVDAPDWRTKAAKEARDAARAAGQIPLLSKTWDEVLAMVAATRAQLADHKDGGAAMFTNGEPEQTIVWREDDIWCRARLDWLRPGAIDDFKTTSASANPDAWTRSMFFTGVDMQAAWYLRGLKALTGEDVIFRFAVQETYPPYALSVIGLGPDALLLAEKKLLYALELWRDCLASGRWPGYPPRTCWASLPIAHEAWWLDKELR